MNPFKGLTCTLAAFAVMLSACGGKAPDAPTAASAPEAPASLARANPSAGKIDYVTVTAEGRGSTVTGAVDQAILMAIQQVNGKTMDASSMQFRGGIAVSVGEDKLDIGSSAFAELVASRTRGAVTDFKLLSQKKLEDGDIAVSIEAHIAKFQKPESAGLLKIVVVPFRTDSGSFIIDESQVPTDRISEDLRQSLVNTLVQTRRVSVIDREFTSEVQGELDLVESGRMATEEFARLGEQLLADYLLVGRIEDFGYQRHERKLRTSDRTLVSHSGGASLSLRLINVTTGQIELSDTVSVELPQTEPTSLGTAVDAGRVSADLTNRLAGLARDAVVARLFPVTVVDVDGDSIVFSQGGKALEQGATYEVVLRGKEVTDPQTGQVIGRIEKHCCKVLVTRVSEDLSYGQVVESAINIDEAVAPGALEVRGRVPAAASPVSQSVAAAVEGAGAAVAAPAPAPVAESTTPHAASEANPRPSASEDKDW